MDSKTGLLKQVSLFSDLNEAAVRKIEGLLVEKHFAKNSIILSQEEPGDALYIVLSGKVKAVLLGKSGREIILSYFKPGEFFGEMALLDNRPRSANAVAVEDVRLLMLNRDAFRQHMIEHPETGMRVMSELCNRIRRADEIIGNLTLLDVYGRVARYLIDLAEREGKRVEDSSVIEGRPTQQEIADTIGTSRETVSRIFSEFKKRGVLKMSGNRLYLKHAFLQEIDRER
ncbi:MAG: Crp/Fnr family transcriptional regulator [Deltaproteobacteria bacterium]|nr:Crp/Fnr family transcriptional regulator [Deltaproteobacteria bacterium]